MYRVRKINFGWFRRKHGILLENLPPLKQKFMIDNSYLKWLNADTQAFEIVFKIEDMHDHEKNVNKILWNPYTETFSTLKEIESDSNIIDWNCAICKVDIKTRMGSTKIEDFVCSDCSNSHNSTNTKIDKRILKSSILFMDHCKSILKKEQKDFIKTIKHMNS